MDINTIPLIRTDCTQLGLHVEASQDNGATWITVELLPFRERSSKTVMAYSRCIDPRQDEQDYYTHLDCRGIQYTRVR
jgi:hypothetical protein